MAMAQCGGTVLTVNNPSFEGPQAPHITPPGWDICMPGVTPDTQPGSWGITLPPSNGNSYLGLVHQSSSNWQEGAGQTLSSPMIAGTTYNFTIDLATTNVYGYGIIPGCVELQLFGGTAGINGGCDAAELLWQSGNVTNLTWVTFPITFTPTQNWNHILFRIQSLGCTDGPYIMVDNMTPLVPMTDIPEFGFNNVCNGDLVQFTDSSASPSGIITNWNWHFGDGDSSVSQDPNHTYAAPGTYSVTLEIYSDVPCTTSVTHLVHVYPIPVANFTPPVGCVGSSVSFTDGSNGNGGTVSNWHWTFGDGGSSTAQNPAHTYYNPGQYNVTLTVVSSDSCHSATFTAPITISQLQANATVIDNVSCFGGADGSGTVTALNGLSPYTYNWSGGGSGANISSLDAGTYTVTVTDSAGCVVVDTLTITEPTLLTAAITNSVNVLCNGDSTGSAVITAAGGTAPYSYNWIPYGGSGSTANGLAAGTYIITVTDGNNCTALDTVTITEPTALSLLLNPTDESCVYSCNGKVEADVYGGVPPYTYHWNNLQTTPAATSLCDGSYSVTVTDANNCALNSTSHVGTSTLVDATFGASPITGSIPLSVNFTFLGTGASQFSWTFGDGGTSTIQNPVHVYPNIGTYTVKLIISSGAPDFCVDTFFVDIIAILPSSLVVPNVFTPNGDSHNDLFKPESVAIGTYSCVIYNRWGKLVYEGTNPAEGWNGVEKSGGDAADGVYYYIIEATGLDGVVYKLNGTVTLIR
ncbi:MAG: PKD domain-containing protein [Bacteroidota bacterium]